MALQFSSPDHALQQAEKIQKIMKDIGKGESLTVYRKKLRAIYSQFVLQYPQAAADHNIEFILWKRVFHQSIEHFRKTIHSLQKTNPERCSKVQVLFSKKLAEYTAFYQEFLSHHLKLCDIQLNEHEFIIPRSHFSNRTLTLSLNTCQRCLIYLGDLQRYIQDNLANNEQDWNPSVYYYKQASHLVCDSGHPHNQLAVVSMYCNENISALYHSYRGIHIEIPFTPSKGNLVRLFSNNYDHYKSMINIHRHDRNAFEKNLAQLCTDWNNFTVFIIQVFSYLTDQEYTYFYKLTRTLFKSLKTHYLDPFVLSNDVRMHERIAFEEKMLQLVISSMCLIHLQDSENEKSGQFPLRLLCKFMKQISDSNCEYFIKKMDTQNSELVSDSCCLLNVTVVFLQWLSKHSHFAQIIYDLKLLSFWNSLLSMVNVIIKYRRSCSSELLSSSVDVRLPEEIELRGFIYLSSIESSMDYSVPLNGSSAHNYILVMVNRTGKICNFFHQLSSLCSFISTCSNSGDFILTENDLNVLESCITPSPHSQPSTIPIDNMPLEWSPLCNSNATTSIQTKTTRYEMEISKTETSPSTSPLVVLTDSQHSHGNDPSSYTQLLGSLNHNSTPVVYPSNLYRNNHEKCSDGLDHRVIGKSSRRIHHRSFHERFQFIRHIQNSSHQRPKFQTNNPFMT